MPTLRQTIGSVRGRRLISGGLLALLSLGLVEMWLVQGLVIPCRVVGDSMAPTLRGVHRRVTCGDCGFSFSCDAEGAVRAVCPNCGAMDQRLAERPDLVGDRVLIDRTAFWRCPPERWQVVALRDPTQSDRLVVKRVVGLPGETIEIRCGDVYADGRIVRKNFAQQQAAALLVHDADFPSQRPAVSSRWRSERSDSRWQCDAGRFFFSGTLVHGSRETSLDWLNYHHERRTAEDAVRPSAVLDLSGYNPGRARREEDVRAVSDLMLSLRVGQMSGRGSLWIRATDGCDDFRVRLAFESDSFRRWQVFHGEGEGDAGSFGVRTGGSEAHRIDVSLIDRQFLLAVDGRTVAVRRDLGDRPPTRGTDRPFGVAAEGIDVTIRQVRVYRDIFYRSVAGMQKIRLPADHFYVLGDNSSESSDSRIWGEYAAVDAKFLLGNVLVAIPSVTFGPVFGRYFQVPNPLGIRYIQRQGDRD